MEADDVGIVSDRGSAQPVDVCRSIASVCDGTRDDLRIGDLRENLRTANPEELHIVGRHLHEAFDKV